MAEEIWEIRSVREPIKQRVDVGVALLGLLLGIIAVSMYAYFCLPL